MRLTAMKCPVPVSDTSSYMLLLWRMRKHFLTGSIRISEWPSTTTVANVTKTDILRKPNFV